MAPKVKYFITADYATLDERSKKLSVNGFFDSFRNVLFPTQSSKFFMILGVYNVEKSAELLLQVLMPDGSKAIELDIIIEAKSLNETINSIIEIEKIDLPTVGIYTVNIINKNDVSLVDSYYFAAEYPPQRIFNEGEIEKILSDQTLAKSSQVKIECSLCKKALMFELNLDPQKNITEGYDAFPVDNTVECCNHKIDLTGLRRQIEWGFGQKIPS